jgi:phosphate transport system substrate-binding protein
MRRTKAVTIMRLAGAIAVVAILVVALAACGSSTTTTSASPAGSTSASPTMPPLTSDTIVGAGATFPQPIYQQWGSEYQGVKGTKLNYQGIGSGGGIAQIEAKTVDFGASDAPLSASDLQTNSLVQWPMVIGGAVPIVNISGISGGQLKLDGDVLAKIFLGTIKTWNDPAITALNPGVNLPSTAITVVHRSDGSGTTWIFTNYLAAVSSTWNSQIGAGKDVPWPVGIGAKGSSGVAAAVSQTDGGIGYVEYTYAVQNKSAYATMKNSAGAFVAPSLQTFQSAANNADWKAAAPAYDVKLVNEPGKDSWPITGASFILMQKDQADAARAKMVLGFFDWAFKNGAGSAKQLNYLPIPPSVYQQIESGWSQMTSGGSPVWP